MNVTAVHQPQMVLKTNKAKIAPNEGNSSYIQNCIGVEQDLNQKQKNSSEIWREISGDYDVRNATFDEISEISRKLYEAGEISLKDLSTLTFDRKKLAEYIRQNVQTPVKSDFNLTPASNEGKRDWIAEFEARAKQDFKFHNLIGYQSNQAALSILKRLDNV